MSEPALQQPQYELINESSLLLRFGDSINEATLDLIAAASHCAEQSFSDALKDLVPSYTTLMIIFDPLQISPWQAQQRFSQLWGQQHSCIDKSKLSDNKSYKTIDIPVYYHPDVGWDLLALAQHTQMDWEELIQLHCNKTYRVYTLGFAPGFAFMGLLDKRLQLPRLASPRLQVPAGSVAIAELQTAIYPALSPGGWQILGRSPITLFSQASTPPNLLSAGDTVRFSAIDRASYLELGGTFDHSNS